MRRTRARAFSSVDTAGERDRLPEDGIVEIHWREEVAPVGHQADHPNHPDRAQSSERIEIGSFSHETARAERA